MYEGKLSLLDVRKWMELSDFDAEKAFHYHSTFATSKTKEVWTFPRQSWWKVNCDAAWVDGIASLAVVVRDDDS